MDPPTHTHRKISKGMRTERVRYTNFMWGKVCAGIQNANICVSIRLLFCIVFALFCIDVALAFDFAVTFAFAFTIALEVDFAVAFALHLFLKLILLLLCVDCVLISICFCFTVCF